VAFRNSPDMGDRSREVARAGDIIHVRAMKNHHPVITPMPTEDRRQLAPGRRGSS
jgi:hypothetical protein